ncbi:hypothetical protein DESUT3_12690 [Desulfuromonas versatilis]|uniref:Phage protein n=1 Tax=Desulfuromonas versatilis TaxID=2802975 RepID=A0ABN6DVW4_9BACT|nr:hypothetical protein [Desulfuromonas versatilis]BCR04200.1 hypothetical protein DESUT3_12690 [Desulfuromonas versatilis]
MIKVKTFGEPLQPFKTHKELDELDQRVNRFIQEKNITKVISVSDTTTSDTTGASIGLVRVLVYES